MQTFNEVIKEILTDSEVIESVLDYRDYILFNNHYDSLTFYRDNVSELLNAIDSSEIKPTNSVIDLVNAIIENAIYNTIGSRVEKCYNCGEYYDSVTECCGNEKEEE